MTNGRHIMSGGRYPVLRSLAILNMVASGILIILGLISACWAVFGSTGIWSMIDPPMTMGRRLLLASAILGGTFFSVVFLLAVAEAMKLFMDIAHSLRMMLGVTRDITAVTGAIARTAPPETVAFTPAAPAASADDGNGNRIEILDEESAEMALIRGH